MQALLYSYFELNVSGRKLMVHELFHIRSVLKVGGYVYSRFFL